MIKEKTMDKVQKHSKFGFVSIGISLCTMLFILYVAYTAMQYIFQNPDFINDPSFQGCIRIPDKIMNWINLLILLPIIGLGIGIFGLCEDKTKKLFSIIGVVINACLLLISPIWLFI